MKTKELYCRRCGYKMPLDSRFCPSCGTKVEELKQLDDIIVEDIEETEIYNESHSVEFKPQQNINENKREKIPGKEFNKILFSCLALALSFILFILSFCNIYTIRYKYDNKTEIKISLSAIDFISIMGGTVHSYKDIEDSELYDEVLKIGEDLNDSLEDDYNERTISKKN